MAPSQPFGESVSDSMASASVPLQNIDHAIGPNGNGAFEQALLYALQAMRFGDFSIRLPGDQTGLPGKIVDTFNDIVAANERMAQQLEHVGNVVGREGKARQRAEFGLLSGALGGMETSINTLIDNLLWPTAAVTRAIAAVAQGDLIQTVHLDETDGPIRVSSCAQRRLSTR
jgi:hypothetical protein